MRANGLAIQGRRGFISGAGAFIGSFLLYAPQCTAVTAGHKHRELRRSLLTAAPACE
ncbi:MAG: hypothetical protein HYV63_27820 [Candidatus Schekmanbacteria bacterium]|nr:hypothetical protein [Candidatus Schekmanbacteria bacterium]